MKTAHDTAMLVRVDYCIGCQACQIACQDQNNLPVEEVWLEAVRKKPKMIEGVLRMTHAIYPEIDKCAECLERLNGVEPICVSNCSLDCLFVGSVDAMKQKMDEAERGVWQLTAG